MLVKNLTVNGLTVSGSLRLQPGTWEVGDQYFRDLSMMEFNGLVKILVPPRGEAPVEAVFEEIVDVPVPEPDPIPDPVPEPDPIPDPVPDPIPEPDFAVAPTHKIMEPTIIISDPPAVDYDAMGLDELVELAKEKGISRASRKKTDTLIEELKALEE